MKEISLGFLIFSSLLIDNIHSFYAYFNLEYYIYDSSSYYGVAKNSFKGHSHSINLSLLNFFFFIFFFAIFNFFFNFRKWRENFKFVNLVIYFSGFFSHIVFDLIFYFVLRVFLFGKFFIFSLQVGLNFFGLVLLMVVVGKVGKLNKKFKINYLMGMVFFLFVFVVEFLAFKGKLHPKNVKENEKYALSVGPIFILNVIGSVIGNFIFLK